ncbi:MAG: protease [Bdellovibrionia bacterium]
MKLKYFLVLAMAITGAFSASAGEFDGGSSEFDQPEYPRYSEAEIQKKIESEMEVACQGNLCKIVGSDSNGSGWTVSFTVGYGNNNGSGTGNNFFIGDNVQTDSDKGYAAVTVTYNNWQCTSELKVTPAVYRFVNTYLYNMVNTDGSVKRNFSPADQTVILFYTTMLNKVENCRNGRN